MNRHIAILACMGLAACSTKPAQIVQPVEAGAEITLAPGGTASLKVPKRKVRFVAVIEDSRCPRDTTCVWAGEVKVQLDVIEFTQTLIVEILEGGSAVAGGIRVTVVRVDPQPVSTARIAPQDYRVTLKLDPAG